MGIYVWCMAESTTLIKKFFNLVRFVDQANPRPFKRASTFGNFPLNLT